MAYDNVLSQLREGIGRTESGNDYSALGPVLKRKVGTDRAYGKYQVMGANIPQWTEQALGRSLTPFEFLHSPEAQEAVFNHQMINNLHKYGTLQDAASVWFSGKPLAQAQREGAHDINLPVSAYVNKVMGKTPEANFGLEFAEAPKKTQTDVLDKHVEDFLGRRKQQEQNLLDQHVNQWLSKRLPAPQVTGNVSEAPLDKPKTSAPPVQQAEVNWGWPQEAANATAFGYLPEVMSKFTGTEPKEYEKAKAKYEQQGGLGPLSANVVGGVVQGIPLSLAGAGALGFVAPKIAAAVPELAPVANWAKRVFSGQAGRTSNFPSGGTLSAPGIGAKIEATTAPVIVGATAGASNAVLNQKLRPDIPLGEQIKEGALWGAGVGSASHYFMGRPGPTFSPEINEPTRKLAQEARARGIPISPWQVTGEAEGSAAQKMAGNVLSHKDWLGQANRFGQAVGKTFGMNGEFTFSNVNKAVQDVSNRLENLSNSINLQPINSGTQPLALALFDLENEVRNDIADPVLQGNLIKVIHHMANSLIAAPASGKLLQSLTQKNGYIDRNFPAQTNSVNKYYNMSLKDIVFDYLEVADKSKAEEWKHLRNMYKNALLGLKLVTPSGVPDAHKLPAAAARVKATGDMKKLAEIATLVPKLVDKGTGRLAEIPPSAQSHTLLPYGIGLGSAALSHSIPELVQNVLGQAEHNIPTGPLMVGLGAGLTAKAAPALYGMAKNFVLSSPRVQDAILSGKMLEKINQAVVNPLAAGAASGKLEVSERVNRRNKK